MGLTRRTLLEHLGTTAAGAFLHPAFLKPLQFERQQEHPHLLISAESSTGFRSLHDIRQDIQDGLARDIWQRMKDMCDRELDMTPLTPRSSLPGRSETFARQNNPDYTICFAAGQRVLRNTLAFLITENKAYMKSALDQIWAIIDESVWPDWIDQAHIHLGHPADLRTGMLSQDLGLAFDWLYHALDQSQRQNLVDGIDRRGIQPFLTSVNQGAWWTEELNNWYTVIIGGLGIAGMGLGAAHPKSEFLVQYSHQKMLKYLSIYGPEGEFNESMAYSNATRIPVNYFYAYHYHIKAATSPLAERPFPQTASWTMYSTLAPNRYPAFGDGHVDAGPEVEFMTAIATATRNTGLQSYCQQRLKASTNPHLLLSFDPTLARTPPSENMDLAKSFFANGAQAYSRSDWDPVRPKLIVYGKSARDHNHEHNDVGQICMDSLGERMIIDLGSPSGYPADFFGENRWAYYNASIRGHNVLMFADQEQRTHTERKDAAGKMDFASISGKVLKSFADDKIGSLWQWDLTNAYAGVKAVRRTMLHLLPGIVAILDEAELEREESVSLRWHLISPSSVDPYGRFLIKGKEARITAVVKVLRGDLVQQRLKRHQYAAPYDRDRIGDMLVQRREAYVDTELMASKCSILSLFAILPDPAESDALWQASDGLWEIKTSEGQFSVTLNDRTLMISGDAKKRISVGI
ncbi:MAG: hypothetical protein HKN87_12065 [Saprospiraceae bacterium]|nr:hypothetical protein [Saprospiraceae bacterium]